MCTSQHGHDGVQTIQPDSIHARLVGSRPKCFLGLHIASRILELRIVKQSCQLSSVQ